MITQADLDIHRRFPGPASRERPVIDCSAELSAAEETRTEARLAVQAPTRLLAGAFVTCLPTRRLPTPRNASKALHQHNGCCGSDDPVKTGVKRSHDSFRSSFSEGKQKMNAQPIVDEISGILDGAWDEVLPAEDESLRELSEPSFTEIDDTRCGWC